MNRITAIIAALLVAATIAARRYTISGYVTEDKSNESLISATVYDSLSSAGCLTNEHGFYSLSLDEGSVALRFSYVGCATQRTAFELTADTVLNIQLTPHLHLAEVEVRGQRSQFGVEGTQMSAIALPVDFIKKLPTFAGEVDIVKAIQLMPGVQAGNEGTSGLYVRGGGVGECLILLDGVLLSTT